MANQLTIRPAIDEDSEGLSQMIAENAQQMLLPHYNDHQWSVFINYYSPEQIRIKIKEQSVFCAELNGLTVGTVALHRDLVAGFYTRLEYLNQGIGQSMMRHLEKFALEKGLKEIRLAASPAGLSFYYKHGWEKIKDITVKHYGVGFQETLMVKRIHN